MARVRYVVLDFDGTCTQVDQVEAGFLDQYRAALAIEKPRWEAAVARVRAAAPKAGWTILGSPSTAPAAADPYILAGETAALLQREGTLGVIPGDLFGKIYGANVAPFRRELADVLAALASQRVRVGFISNSDGTAVGARLTDLLTANPKLRARIHVHGNAAKFTIKELPLESKNPHRARFDALPGAQAIEGVGRPVYLRRAAYFEALCGMYQAFDEPGFPIADTLVCGDIWELDLAMPAALGAQVHLIERAAPYPTYDYERAQVGKGVSRDLKGLLKRL